MFKIFITIFLIFSSTISAASDEWTLRVMGGQTTVKKIDMSGLHAPYVNGSSDPTGTPVLLDLVSSAGQKSVPIYGVDLYRKIDNDWSLFGSIYKRTEKPIFPTNYKWYYQGNFVGTTTRPASESFDIDLTTLSLGTQKDFSIKKLPNVTPYLGFEVGRSTGKATNSNYVPYAIGGTANVKCTEYGLRFGSRFEVAKNQEISIELRRYNANCSVASFRSFISGFDINTQSNAVLVGYGIKF